MLAYSSLRCSVLSLNSAAAIAASGGGGARVVVGAMQRVFIGCLSALPPSSPSSFVLPRASPLLLELSAAYSKKGGKGSAKKEESDGDGKEAEKDGGVPDSQRRATEIAKMTASHTKTIEFLTKSLSTLQTGRARPEMLNGVKVKIDEATPPISAVATIVVSNPTLLTATVTNPKDVLAVEEAIRNSKLGLNPSAKGNVVSIPIPKPTLEQRKNLVGMAKTVAETAKVSVRRSRQECVTAIKALSSLSLDEKHRSEKEIDKMTNDCIAKLDAMLVEKESEIMK